ncbi:hypothetical protein C8F04DRAFT_1080017 [Mycena alexandri]|uniref:Secreted protein n=1 Tax=Mycena alexandri TaxID=1745969 RepID=A0AAD6X9A8_9AGAR|nr:hypothetical protein C8F04DRAFT_1080017 [Mycena alexandri]
MLVLKTPTLIFFRAFLGLHPSLSALCLPLRPLDDVLRPSALCPRNRISCLAGVDFALPMPFLGRNSVHRRRRIAPLKVLPEQFLLYHSTPSTTVFFCASRFTRPTRLRLRPTPTVDLILPMDIPH